MNSLQSRASIRRKRRALSSKQQLQHAHRLAQHIRQSPIFQKTHFACYWATDGEISLRPLIELLLSANKKVYLPVLQRQQNALNFVRYRPEEETQTNRFGIVEPTSTESIDNQRLDVIFLPLVGFDKKGHRLGMGGGFYDRTLAPFRHRATPLRIGVAHQCQQLRHIPKQRWDIPLHGQATELGLNYY